MSHRFRTLAVVATTGVLLLSSTTLAGAADAPQVIGDFESDALGSTTPAGWTVMNQVIDLGVTRIAGCTTTDTSDYTSLRDLLNQAPAGYDPISRADSPPPEWDRDPAFSATVVDGGSIADFEDEETGDIYDLAREGRVLEITSDLAAEDGPEEYYGYVVHGPAVYSNIFTSDFGRQLSFSWAASGASDDFHVFGYLLNTATCEQTEVVDATGLASEWQESIVNVPDDGTYRFVFVGGTFDQSFGGAAGGTLWIDSVIEAESTLPLTGQGASVTFLALLGVALVASGVVTTRRAIRRT